MIRSLSVRNLRGLTDVQIEDIPPINLLTGINAAGKTSMLEAVLLASNPDPEHVAWLSTHRLGGLHIGPEGPPWRELWPNLAGTAGPEVKAVGTGPDGNGEWTVRLAEARQADLVPVGLSILPEGPSSHESRRPLTISPSRLDIDVAVSGGPLYQAGLLWSLQTGFQALVPTRPPVTTWARFLAGPGTPEQDCAAFGAVQAVGESQVDKVLQALRPMEPRLRRLFITLDGAPRLNADLGDAGTLPVHLLGDGARRVLTYVLAALGNRLGILLVDEIENGLHHSQYAHVWSALCAFVQASRLQLFAVTHSAEFLREALRDTSADAATACWHLEPARPTGMLATRLDGADARAAVSFGIDVR